MFGLQSRRASYCSTWLQMVKELKELSEARSLFTLRVITALKIETGSGQAGRLLGVSS